MLTQVLNPNGGNVGGGGGGSVNGTGVSGQVAFWNGVSNITGNADFTWDNIGKNLTVNGKLTVTGAIDPTSISLAGTAANTFVNLTNGNTVPVSPANQGRIRYNSASQSFEVSENGGSWADLSIGGNAWLQGGNSFGALGVFGTNDAFGLAIRTNGSEKLRILTTGNVGIGTTTPSQLLDVNGNAIIKNHMAAGANSAVNDGSLLYPGALFLSICSFQESFTSIAPDFIEGLTNYVELNPSGAPSYEAFAADCEITIKSGNVQSFAGIGGGFFSLTHNGSGLISSAMGSESVVTNAANGTLNLGISLFGQINNLSTGTIDNGVALYASKSINSGGGTLTNNYGLYLENQSGVGTNNWNVFSDGASSINTFLGSIGIGILVPLAPLHINATAFSRAFWIQSGFGRFDGGIFLGGGSIAQPFTTYINGDLYSSLDPNSGTDGGLHLQSYINGDSIALRIAAAIGSTTPVSPVISFDAAKWDGATGKTSLATSTEIAFQISNNGTSIIDVLGDNSSTFHGNVLGDFFTSNNGFNVPGNLFYVDDTGTMTVQFSEFVNGLSACTGVGNVIIGTGIAGSNAAQVLVLSNTATAPTDSVDIAQLYSADSQDGFATLAVFTEQSVAADVALVSTSSIKIFWNGSKYKIPLISI